MANPNLNWQDITSDLRKLAGPPPVGPVPPVGALSVHHPRVATIITSMDDRYQGVTHIDGKGLSVLTGWAKGPLPNKRHLCVMATQYNDDPVGTKPWRQMLAVTYADGSVVGALKGIHLEMLGICRDHPAQTTPAQWQPHFADWFRDIKDLIARTLSGAASVDVVAVVPPSMTWAPMQDFHAYMIDSLRHDNLIINSSPPVDGFITYTLRIQAP